MYTVMDLMPFRDKPYRTYLGTLSRIGIQSQGKFKAGKASGLNGSPRGLTLENCLGRIVPWSTHHAAAGMGS